MGSSLGKAKSWVGRGCVIRGERLAICEVLWQPVCKDDSALTQPGSGDLLLRPHQATPALLGQLLSLEGSYTGWVVGPWSQRGQVDLYLKSPRREVGLEFL